MKRIIQKFIISTFIISLIFPSSLSAFAETSNTEGSAVIVSMGDSYSSGEGIDNFYDCSISLVDKVKSQDWLAHRSQNAWGGKLTLPTVDGEMAKHKNDNWFFVAMSGAITANLLDTEPITDENKQEKSYRFKNYYKTYPLTAAGLTRGSLRGSVEMDLQIDIFEKLKKDGKQADYVTLTLGGNDAGFTDIVVSVMLGSTYLGFSDLSDKLNNTWKKFYENGGIRDNLKKSYDFIAEKAGEKTKIIVAGYPKLFDSNGKGFLVSQKEANSVNSSVSEFNKQINKIVNECDNGKKKLYFVPVEDAFDGHEAYSDNAWINNVEFIIKEQDISDFDPGNGVFVSAYSMHPNLEGAKAYAKCVQDKIDEIEKDKKINNNLETKSKSKNISSQSYLTERDIVLVLDASGSMDGTPLEETKKAATKFVDTVLGNSANIGIVKYDGKAEIVSPFSTDGNALKSAISNIGTGGSTNIEDGLSTAESMLSGSSANKKIIVLMSDGEPNDGKVGDELIAYANELKNKDTYIYTLGFFESISNKTNAQYLMEKIASDGCHYEVSDADSLVYFFGDIADQINGQKYIYVRIACPVDVSVSYNGETLNSAESSLITRTSFGSLTFEDTDTQEIESYNSNTSTTQPDESGEKVKILRLKEGEDYDIKIEGTGKGRMNYSIGFMDENGEYSDFRKFNNVKITRKTQIDTVAKVSDKTVLNVDEDGDGKYDLTYEARANSRGEIVDNSFIVNLILILLGVLVLLIIILIIYKKVQKTKIKKSRRDYNG